HRHVLTSRRRAASHSDKSKSASREQDHGDAEQEQPLPQHESPLVKAPTGQKSEKPYPLQPDWKPLAGRGVAAHAVEQERGEAVRELVRLRAGPEPGVGPVRGGEREQRRGRVVEIGPQLAELAPLAVERAEAVLAAAALGDERVPPLPLELATLPK